MAEFENTRPDPDELLANLIGEEGKRQRGRLRIFFGMCAGVGKTYTMLQTALAEKQKGSDVIIGYVETHNRKETEALTGGIERLERNKIEYKSTQLEEMDLDAVLLRKPYLVLVDELAHNNAPGSRHAKRYQDVQEILAHGINVYTTLNVQHLESRSETVAQITGIIVRETVPDDIFENADEVELVDITTGELLQRLTEGKIYAAETTKSAVENFFKIGNITALREMALRLVADRVDKQLHDYMQNNRIRGPWKSGLHLLVAMSYYPQSARLLRWAKNLAYSMGANIEALYVETPHTLTKKETEQLDRNINLAKHLGIRVRIITHHDIVKAIVDFAQKENATHIVVGKPRVRDIISMIRLGNFVNRLIRYSGNIDVYVLGSDMHAKDHFRDKVSMPSFTASSRQYLATVIMVILTSLGAFLTRYYMGYQVVSFILLFLVSILALFFSTGPVLIAACLSAVIWDYFFIPPVFTLHIEKTEDVLMLFMFFFIALMNGILTTRIRGQEKKIRTREERTHALYQLSRDLTQAGGVEEVAEFAHGYIRKSFNCESAILLKDENSKLETLPHHESGIRFSENDLSVASWVFINSARAGKFTETLPSCSLTFYPLTGTHDNNGVVALELSRVFTEGEQQFWEAFISQVSGRLERELLRNAAKNTYLLSESEKMYKTLFNSISHELRIPVATVMGASDILLGQELPAESRKQLYTEINDASIRLNRLIENLLNMSRLETGRISPQPDWCDVHDLSNQVIHSLKQEIESFILSVIIPDDMPLVKLDFGLMEQILHNLVLNAAQNSPAGSTIRMKFYYDSGSMNLQVMDRGSGFGSEDLTSVFNKFYRTRPFNRERFYRSTRGNG
jgi:two-component system sensor histidine kinase KdpD